ARDQPGTIRRHRDHQPVRRHPVGRGVGPRRRPGTRTRGEHRRNGRDLRGGARLRARYRGAGDREPVGADARGRDDARPHRRARGGGPAAPGARNRHRQGQRPHERPGRQCFDHRVRPRRGRVVLADLSHRAEDSARMVEMKWALLVLLAGPLAGQTSLSIYSDGRVVVRRTLAQALEKGRNTLTLQLEDLDPATLFSPDTSAAIVSAVVRAPTDREAALRHAVGQTLAFVVERSDGRRDTVRASVVRVTPPQYRLSDGRFLLAEPGEPLFPAGLVRTAPEVAVVLDATRSRPRTELTWVAQGASWEATYQVVLAGARCEVSGTATIL